MENTRRMTVILVAVGLLLAFCSSGQIIPAGYELIDGEYVDEAERQYSEAYGATFVYFKDEEIGRILHEGIEEVYEEAKKVMTSYGYDFLAPDFEDTNIPIEEWGADADATSTMILSGSGWVRRAWVMVDYDKKTYLASMDLTKEQAIFRIDEWDPENE